MNPATFGNAPIPDLAELQGAARENAAPLFADLAWHLAVPAVLAGAAIGAVYADTATTPRSALLLAGHRAYLAGDPSDAGFLSALPPVLERRLVPDGHESGDFVLYYDRPEWAAAVEAALAPWLAGYRSLRRCFFSRDAGAGPVPAPAAPLPEGFRLAAVDRALLDDPTLPGRDELVEEVCSERVSVDDFLARSFGTVLLHEGGVAGWCLSEYNLGRRCEVGIAVDGPFRRRGLATRLGSAFARQALTAAGIAEIGWHCWEDNAASCATARALGFALVRTYPARWVRLARAGPPSSRP
jgi:GNAT superfamily N-acetyltransferase